MHRDCALLFRHGPTCSGHPRVFSFRVLMKKPKNGDARDKHGHDVTNRLRRRTPFLAPLLLLLSLALAACGFHPLYGDHASGATDADFASVYIAPMSDRSGQQLRNFLLERVEAGGQPSRPLYVMNIGLALQSSGLAISRDNTTSRASITGTAKYTIVDSATGQVLARGTSRATDSYDVLLSDFATLSARDDANTRVLREISDDLKTRLAVFLQSRKPMPPTRG